MKQKSNLIMPKNDALANLITIADEYADSMIYISKDLSRDLAGFSAESESWLNMVAIRRNLVAAIKQELEMEYYRGRQDARTN